MNSIKETVNHRFIKIAARFMKLFCYLSICGYIVSVIFCISGRNVVVIHTKNEEPPKTVIYEEKQQGIQLRIMTAGPDWDIHVWTDDSNKIDKVTYAGLVLMFTLYAIIGISAETFLLKIFSNLQNGQVFTEQNGFYLRYYGLLQIGNILVLPLLNYLITYVSNLVSQSRTIFEVGGSGLLNKLAPCIVYIVAAYIIHYGFNLQDEVDHTL